MQRQKNAADRRNIGHMRRIWNHQNRMPALLAAAAAAVLLSSGVQAQEYTDKETVKKVQEALNVAGYDCGTPDGVAGSKTYQAIEAFQKAKGLETGSKITDELLTALELAGNSDEETAADPLEEAKNNLIPITMDELEMYKSLMKEYYSMYTFDFYQEQLEIARDIDIPIEECMLGHPLFIVDYEWYGEPAEKCVIVIRDDEDFEIVKEACKGKLSEEDKAARAEEVRTYKEQDPWYILSDAGKLNEVLAELQIPSYGEDDVIAFDVSYGMAQTFDLKPELLLAAQKVWEGKEDTYRDSYTSFSSGWVDSTVLDILMRLGATDADLRIKMRDFAQAYNISAYFGTLNERYDWITYDPDTYVRTLTDEGRAFYGSIFAEELETYPDLLDVIVEEYLI